MLVMETVGRELGMYFARSHCCADDGTITYICKMEDGSQRLVFGKVLVPNVKGRLILSLDA
jgi:hypothetical protein